MAESDRSLRELEERARKREAIGLSPNRPTAQEVVYSPPEAKRGRPFILLLLVVLVVAAAAFAYLRSSILVDGPFAVREPAPMEVGRLIARDEFADPLFTLPVRRSEESDQRYVGDLYRLQVTRSGARVWATLGQLNLGAYRLEADLRLASQELFSWGYGGLIVRYQNDENFYLFVVDGEGQYQIELVKEGAWRTVRPWAQSNALSDGRQNILSVADDGAELRLFINAVQVDAVTDPRLPAGDVGLIVGARSQGHAQGLFDWVALYEISLAK